MQERKYRDGNTPLPHYSPYTSRARGSFRLIWSAIPPMLNVMQITVIDTSAMLLDDVSDDARHAIESMPDLEVLSTYSPRTSNVE